VSHPFSPLLAPLTGVIVLAIVLLTPQPLPARQDPTTGSSGVRLDSLQESFQRTLSTLSSPELEERRSRRRELQKQGYTEVLHELLAGDGVTALMSWIRITLQLEYSIPQRPLYLFVRPPETSRDTSLAGRLFPSSVGYVRIILQEDRSFPADPWMPERKRSQP
jgi:hypothetical protein